MKSQQSKQELLPAYPHSPIHGLSALSKALGVHENVLIRCAERADKLYRLAWQEEKADGSLRQTFDAFPVLKAIQIKIKHRILQRVIYPPYLHGSLPGCSPRTNAAMHLNAKISIAEDIANFFPSTSLALVQDVWAGLFRFSADVAEVLSKLTTKCGGIPQGAVTSSYLANLVFWRYEPTLVTKFLSRGLSYSRYVDDVNVSSSRRLTVKEKTQTVADVYGMLLHHGFQPKRSKHEIFTSAGSMQTTKLLVNRRVGLPNKQRQNIRAAVYALEQRVIAGERGQELTKELASVSTRVGRLGSFHGREADHLKKRLKVVRRLLIPDAPKDVTGMQQQGMAMSAEPPPWDVC